MDTRPTTDRVRESVFSALNSALGGFEDTNVLDMFAGSGAFGIEAISRGATHATFWDVSSKAAKVVSANLASLSIGSAQATVSVCDALSERLPYLPQKVNVVYADPPYATFVGDVAAAFVRLAQAGMLATDAICAYERASDAPALEPPEGFEVVKSKRYGNTSVDFLRYIQNSEER
jgi:16S rRNA (guanine966-N2)-methyltransferase